jgi:hypothetical protein
MINKIIKNYLDENNILNIDLLEPLRKAIPQKALYPSNHDGHPNKNGYEVMAGAIVQFLGGLPGFK